MTVRGSGARQAGSDRQARTAGRKPVWLLALVGLLLALAALAGSGIDGGTRTVEAHALLARAEPPANAQVREPPTQLSLYFTEPLERRFSRARVVDQSNVEMQDRIEFDDSDNSLMRVVLKPLTPGYYVVYWENVSTVDGHRISGSYPLTVLQSDGALPPGAPPSIATETTGQEADPLRVLTKALLLFGGALLTGSLAFLFFAGPSLNQTARDALRLRVVIVSGVALALLALGGVFELLLQSSELSTNIADVLDTQWGGRWSLRNVALTMPLIVTLMLATRGLGQERWVPVLGLVGSAAYLAVVSSVSHAAAGEGAVWAASADFVHLVAASVWIGMLAQVSLLVWWSRRNLEREERYSLLVSALKRFSFVATVSVALLLFTGVISALIQVARPSDLLDSAYGRALLIKLVLLVPLLGVGAVNGYVLRPGIEEETEGRLKGRESALAGLESSLSRLLRWEISLAVLVLLVAGLLSQETPTRGRADSGPTGGIFIATSQADDVGVTLSIDPNQPGNNTFEVYLTGGADVVERVRLDITPEGRPEDEARLILDASNPPTYYVGQGPYMAQAGKWNIAVDMRRTRGNDLRVPFEVNVVPPGGVPVVSTGGDFSSPLKFTAPSVLILLASGVFAVIVVAGSVRRPDMPAGYMGEVIGGFSDRFAGSRLRPAWSLAVLIFVGLGLGLALGSHFDRPLTRQEASRNNPVESSPESIARGMMLFNTNCAQCHGETGRGDGPVAASLRIPPANLYDHIPYHPDQFFFQVMTNGLSNVMPAFRDSISEEDRWNILNYLRDRFGEAPAVQ